jgi:hypothetical protein
MSTRKRVKIRRGAEEEGEEVVYEGKERKMRHELRLL